MPKPLNTLLVYARPSIARKPEALKQLIASAQGFPVDLWWHCSFAGILKEFFPGQLLQFFDPEQPCPEPIQRKKAQALVLTLGGDGTLLDGVQFAVGWDFPVFGFHLGRLGFLSSAGGAEDFAMALSAILDGDIELEHRSLVECRYPAVSDSENPDIEKSESGQSGPGQFGAEGSIESAGFAFALNEIVLHRQGGGLMRITCRVDGEILNHYQADGLLVSTPTGSTAYSMSCGGPIVLPRSGVLLITPVAGHQLGIRPVILPDHCKLQLTTVPEGGRCQLMADGKMIDWRGYGDIEIQRYHKTLALARLKGFSDFHSLKTKLMWGLDMRG
jgi:NAD+ kinase